MPVNITWLNDENRVLYFDYIGLWTWEESYAAIRKSNEMMNEVNHPVGSIVDFTNTQNFPDGLADAMKVIAELRGGHPNDTGETVYVNAEVLTKAMFDVIRATDPEVAKVIKFTHSKTVEESENLILQVLDRQLHP